MRALKALVIVMGVLLVGGTAVLVTELISRASHRGPVGGSAGPARPFDTVLDLPAGASIREMRPVGERLVLRVGLAGGGEQILLLDIGSGARLGTIELRTAR